MTREDVEAMALAHPAATKIDVHGADVFKVMGKVFAVCEDALTFKASEIGYAVLTDGGPGRPAKGFQRGRWVSVPLPDVDADDAARWMDDSYDTVVAGLTRAARKRLA